MNHEKTEHPAFGMLGFSRVSGGDGHLFGSSVEHDHKIQLTLKRGSVARELNKDWYYGKETLFEVEMSYTQFAELISAMNVGDGVPVTIRYVRGEENIPPLKIENKRKQFVNEFKAQQNETLAMCASTINDLRNMFSEKKPMNKAQKEEIISRLSKVYNDLTVNTDFTLKQFDEAMEKIATEAKGEVEAFVQNKLNSLALHALKDDSDIIGLIDMAESVDSLNGDVSIEDKS